MMPSCKWPVDRTGWGVRWPIRVQNSWQYASWFLLIRVINKQQEPCKSTTISERKNEIRRINVSHSHAFRLKSCKKTSSELENLSSASVASTSDYYRRKLYKLTSDWACFSLRYRNLACSTRYLFTTMFLIDNSKKGDMEYYKVSLCELVFWVIRAKLQSGFV